MITLLCKPRVVASTLRLLAGLLLATATGSAASRLWTSTAGTRLEAEHVATINQQYWLKTTDGRLFKIAPDQLSDEDQTWLYLQRHPAPGWVFPYRGAPIIEVSDADAIQTLEALATIVVPSFSTTNLDLQTALNRLTEALALAAPDQKRIQFLVTEGLEIRPLNMTLRNLSGLRMLSFLCGSGQSLKLSARFDAGNVRIEKHASASQVPGTVYPKPARIVLRDYSSAPDLRDACSAPASSNLLFAGGFEESSSRWVFNNRQSSFQRVPASEAATIPRSPDLGATVLRLRPAPNDGDPGEGPPFVVQKFELRGPTDRLLVCCDVAYVGAPVHSAGFRLSITDPDLRYIHGSGLKFPFVQVPIKDPGQWRHIEWRADVSTIRNRAMQVGLMLPYSEGNWYIDNVRVTTLPDEG